MAALLLGLLLPVQVASGKCSEATEAPTATLPAAAVQGEMADLEELPEASAGIPQTQAPLPLEQPEP